MTPDDVLESLAEECHTDHVGLWEIVDAVRFDLGSTNVFETRALTLRLVRSLLSERGMQVGHPAPDRRHFVLREAEEQLIQEKITGEIRGDAGSCEQGFLRSHLSSRGQSSSACL